MALKRLLGLLGATLLVTLVASPSAFADSGDHEEKRWSKVIAQVPAATEQHWHLSKTIPAQEEETRTQYKYWQTVPAVPKKTHAEFLFRKAVANSHNEYQQRTREIRQRWTVGLTYAQDVYTRTSVPAYQESVQYKYDRFLSQPNFFARTWQWSQTGETDWGEQRNVGSLDTPPTGLFQEMLTNEQTQTSRIETGSQWQYSKVASKGDRHPSLYGPYDVFANPKKVGFVVGIDQRLVGQPFDLGESAYDAMGNDIVVQYVYRQVQGPLPAGYTDWSEWSEWSQEQPGSQSALKQVLVRSVEDPSTWAYLTSNSEAVSNKSKAAWHRPTDRIKNAGWEAFRKQIVVDQEAVPESTIYLMEDGSTTSDSEKAAWLDAPTEHKGEWNQLLDDQGQPVVNTVVTRPATPERVVYLDANGEETDDPSQAGWYTDASQVDETGWSRVDEESHEVSPEVAEHTVYFVPDGEPTTTLGDSNWTILSPEGWTTVDSRWVNAEGVGATSGTHPAVNIEWVFLTGLVVLALATGFVVWRVILSRQRNSLEPDIKVPTVVKFKDSLAPLTHPSANPRKPSEVTSEGMTIRLNPDGSMRRD